MWKIEKHQFFSNFSFSFDGIFMKFGHNIPELSKKKIGTKILIFSFLTILKCFFDTPPDQNFGFWPPERPKIKNSKFWSLFFFLTYFRYIVSKFHKDTIKTEGEDRFLVFFQKTFWGQILPKIEHKWPSQPWKSMYKLV